MRVIAAVLFLAVSGTVQSACPVGKKGSNCEMCMDDYFKPYSGSSACIACDCSGNHDPFYSGSMCNNITGNCNRCMFHTKGRDCEVCDDDYFGDARSKSCQRCHCHECGREKCDSTTGQCVCKKNVVGRYCDECLPEHYGLSSCEGCEPCNCSPIGSWCNDCHPETGNCKCKPGVTGRACDQCMPSFWSFSDSGCKPCQCPNQRPCDPVTGECLPCGNREKETPCGCVGCGPCVDSLINLSEVEILRALKFALSSINETALSASISRALEKYYETFTELEESVNVILDAQNSINTGDRKMGLSRDLESLVNEVNFVLSRAQTDNNEAISLFEPIIQMLNAVDQQKEFLKYNLTIEYQMIEKDLFDLQTRGQKEQTTMIKQLSKEIASKVAGTGDVNDTIVLVLAQAQATKNRVDNIYGKVVDQLGPVVDIEKQGDSLVSESTLLISDLIELQKFGREANDSAANTFYSLNFVLKTKSEQYERDVVDAQQLFDRIATRVEQTKEDAEVIANITDEIAKLNMVGAESVFELRGNASQFGGWVDQLRINVANVSKQVEAANKTIKSILDTINANLTFGNVSSMAKDIETFFTLKDELLLSVEFAASNASKAVEIADKFLSLLRDLQPQIMEINYKNLNLTERINFPNLGKESLNKLNQELGQISFKKDRIQASINLIANTLKELEESDFVNWAKNISKLSEYVVANAADTAAEVEQLNEDVNDSLDELNKLKSMLRQTRDDIAKSEQLVSNLPELAKKAQDSMLRNGAGMKEVRNEKDKLDVKFARLNDKLREIESAVNMGMWAVKFNASQKSYVKLRTPAYIRRPHVQYDLRVVVSGVDSIANPNGLLFFFGNYDSDQKRVQDYLGLQLEDGSLKFFWSTTPGQRLAFSTEVEFDPSESYTVRVLRSGFETKLLVYKVNMKASSDGDLIASKSMAEQDQYPKLIMHWTETTEFFFGGVPSSASYFNSVLGNSVPFTGCMHLFMLNDVVINIWNYESASQVSACNPDIPQSPYYRWDDYGFACSWEPDSYIKRYLKLDNVFTGSVRASIQESVKVTDMNFVDYSDKQSSLAYAILKNKNDVDANGKVLASNFLDVKLQEFDCEVSVANGTIDNYFQLYDRRQKQNKTLSEMNLDFLTQSGSLYFSSELKLSGGYKVRSSREEIKQPDFSLNSLQNYDMDLFVAGVNSEIETLKRIESNEELNDSDSVIGCLRLRNMFASPKSHSEWLDYDNWTHAGFYLYPLSKPAFFSLELEGRDTSLYAMVNPPKIGNKLLFQIKTKASDALILFLMAPDEMSSFSLSLVEGSVQVIERRSKSPDQIYSLKSDSKVNDGKWHSIAIVKQVTSRQWILTVDDEKQLTTVAQLVDSNTVEDFSGQVLYVGGVPAVGVSDQFKKSVASTRPFDGCIKDLVIPVADQDRSVQSGVENEFTPAVKWNQLSPGAGSSGYSVGCREDS